MFRIASLFTCLLFATWLKAQEPHPFFRSYGVDNGLPSSEVYSVKQDSKGYIWFATVNGVSRFDGYSFENFSMDDGLPDNTVFDIYEDSTGRIWFLPISNKLSYYYKGKIYPYKYNDRIQQALKRMYLKTSFVVDSRGTVSLGLQHFGICEVDSTGHVKIDPAKNTHNGLFIRETANGELVWYNLQATKKCDPTKDDSSIIFQTSRLTTRLQVPAVISGINNPFACRLHNGDVALGLRNSLLITDSSGRYKTYHFDDRIVWIYEDADSDLWIGTYQGGVFHVQNRDFEHRKRYLPGCFVTCVIQDKDGGVWFTTGNKAVFYTPSKQVLTCEAPLIPDRTGIKAIASNGKSLFISVDNFKIQTIDTSGMPIDNRCFEGRFKQEIERLYYDSLSGNLLICSNQLVKMDQGTCHFTSLTYFNDIVPYGSGQYWICSATGIALIDKNGIVPTYIGNTRFQRVDALLLKDRNTLLVGCPDGLWQCDIPTMRFLSLSHISPLLKERILDLAYLPDSTLCIATRGAGLLLSRGGLVRQLSKKDGLSSNNIRKLIVESGRIWLATDNGLNCVQTVHQGQMPVDVISTYDGIASNDIQDLLRFRGKMWVATDLGLSFFDPGKISRPAVSAGAFISSLLINDKPMDLRDSFELDPAEMVVRIVYTALDYKRPGKIRYRYRMEGLDTAWTFTAGREAQYTTLPPGNYRFVVESDDASGRWNGKGATMAFTVLTPFWQTWWFVTAAVLLLITVVFISVSYVLRRRQTAKYREKGNQRLLAALRLKALRAQMNPHFVFNVMNSIQHFIVHHNSEAAQRYLTKFSRLIRITLNHTEQNTAPLGEELSALELYLDLENMRFETEFSYTIHVADEIDAQHTGIPSMLIQPYVENAIKHGFLKSPRRGSINITITKEDKRLKCVIEDNGIGRRASSHERDPQYRSFGTSVTRERLEVLNELYEGPIPETIVDLKDAQGEALGTRVELLIPFVMLKAGKRRKEQETGAE